MPTEEPESVAPVSTESLIEERKWINREEAGKPRLNKQPPKGTPERPQQEQSGARALAKKERIHTNNQPAYHTSNATFGALDQLWL